MYAISFPGFCGSYEEIHGWSQSHYRDLKSSCNCNVESGSTCHVNSYVIMAPFQTNFSPIKPLGLFILGKNRPIQAAAYSA